MGITIVLLTIRYIWVLAMSRVRARGLSRRDEVHPS